MNPQLVPLIFTRLDHAVVFWTIYLIWVISELIRSGVKRPTKDAVRRDRGSLAVVYCLVTLGAWYAFYLAFAFPAATLTDHRELIFWIGIAIMIAGMSFRTYAVRVLGKSFTFSVAVRPDQTVVTTGPYRLIRHPSYTGAIITVLGAGMALTNWASVISFVAGTLLAYSYRIPVEERALREEIGQPYVDYMKHTWRLIPYVY